MRCLIFCVLLASCVSYEDKATTIDLVKMPAATELLGKELDEVLVTKDAFEKGIEITDLSRLSSKYKKAVLNIYVEGERKKNYHLLPSFVPGPKLGVGVKGQSLGSAFCIHPDGYLITNEHVIRNARKISALASSGEVFEVEVLAYEGKKDLALLKLKSLKEPFPVIPMCVNNFELEGDFVIAIGNPYGFGHSVTLGVVSQVGRDLSNFKNNATQGVSFIQTDTAINPGSSGGPLISLVRGWVGVNTVEISNTNALNFAVPNSAVVDFLNELIIEQ